MTGLRTLVYWGKSMWALPLSLRTTSTAALFFIEVAIANCVATKQFIMTDCFASPAMAALAEGKCRFRTTHYHRMNT